MSELFDHLPDQPTPAPAGLAGPRLRRPDRDQMILCPGSLDALLPAEHMVRSVEAFVGTLDLSPLYHAIRAREGTPGHPPADPRLIVALWLYATIDGVGSARELARLCDTALPYQWLCGGVSVNHHSLSDARLACAAWLDQALISSIAVLCQAGAVTLNTVAQDGLRVRASAGAGSFRRRPTLQRCLAEAKAQVETLNANSMAMRAPRCRGGKRRCGGRRRIGRGGWNRRWRRCRRLRRGRCATRRKPRRLGCR
jgi:transposase